MVAPLAAAGVPYGVFNAMTGELWWAESAQGLLSRTEQRELERYLSSVAHGSSAVHACVVGGRLEPVGVPRVRLAVSAHPEVSSATIVVLTPRPAAPQGLAMDRLSLRERAVAELIARGESTKCIAADMGISEHTVRRHTEHLFTKLGVRTRAAVAAMVAATTV
ncbi:helix-turn-helix transcriptional regulator [Gemmatimonas sp.]|uniref:helix-turn-helix transcriptional regulator n=1 Tax=Gemmatimonas sp. TaxID=1962908 RepID=UPI00286DCDBA|nr:helix-turn-helix transcriptional regulator [Gemmatimonas sp.]